MSFLDLLSSLILMMAIYILSIGPLYWQWYASICGYGWPVLAVIYRPLQWMAILCPPFGAWVDWYVSLWIL